MPGAFARQVLRRSAESPIVSLSRRERVEELFEQVGDEPAAERRRRLELACGEDLELVEEVLSLFEAESRGSKVLQHDLASLAHALLDTGNGPAVPGRFGRYIIRGYLGQGGMGAVYVAERDGLGDRVAVKFLHNPWNSPSRQEAFAREQRTLASLTHRYIARLYDAGVADETPWFAMEYVEGFALTEYCRRNSLSLGARLLLFRAACEAVSYAHRNLTVHLDLKPSNILVNPEGEVKLVDFGVAQPFYENVERDADLTRRPLSLNYAAPEQIRGEPPDVQMDVYALGVILYVLLTGKLPANVAGATPADLDAVLDKQPTPPSVAVSAPDLPEVTASKADWSDLDALCLAAIQRDRSQRYATVDDLVRDLDRFRKLEPLRARPARMPYRAGKFLRRNRRSVSATTAALVLIAALSIFFTIRLITTRERALVSEARTRRIYQMMLNLFEGDDQAAGPTRQLRVVALLDRGVLQLDTLGQEPDLQAELRYTLGGLYHRLGHLNRAEPLLESAWNTGRLAFGRDHPETIKAEVALAALRADQSQLDEADRLARESVELAKHRYAPGSVEVAGASAMLGKVLALKGDYKGAIPVLENAIAVLERGPGSVELSEALGDLGNAYYSLGHIADCEAVNLRGLALDRKLFGEAHPNTGIDFFNLANIQLDRANYSEAERLFRRSLTIDLAWYGELHPKTASAAMMVGRAVAYQGRLDEADSLYRQALNTMRQVYGESHFRVAVVLSLMGDLETNRHNLIAANKMFQQSAAIFKKTFGDQHEFYQHQLSNLATVRLAARQFSAAEQLLRPALAHLKAAVPDQRYTALAEVRLGAALAGQKKWAEAETYLVEGYNRLRRLMGPRSLELLDARTKLLDLYSVLNLPAKAEALRVEALQP